MERLMSRRGFVQAAGAAGVGRLLASRDQQSPAPPKGPKEERETGDVRKLPAGVEGRGIWTYYGSKKKPLSEKVIGANLEQIAKANLNMVFLPIGQLDTSLPIAKKLGLQTHLNIHAIHYPKKKRQNSQLETMPGGFPRSTLCVNQKEVRDHNIKRILGFINRYPELDGIHIDWVGQDVEWHHGPGWVSVCYCKVCRDGFKRDHGVDPLQIARDSGKHKEMVPKWIRWRLDFVNRYVVQMRDAFKKAKSDLALSATSHQTLGLIDAVDGPYACSANFQEWGRWMANGWLEFFAPMAYTCDQEGFRYHMKQVKRSERQAGGKSYAYVGIGQTYLVDEQQLPEQIEIIRKNGLGGFSIFASLPERTEEPLYEMTGMETIGEHWWKTLEEFLTKPAQPPHTALTQGVLSGTTL